MALSFLFGTAKKTGTDMAAVMFINTTAYPIRCHLSVKSTKVSGDVGPSGKAALSIPIPRGKRHGYIMVEQLGKPGAAAAGRVAGCTFIRVALDTRQHTAEIGTLNAAGYSVIYDQLGCNSRPTKDQLLRIDAAADDPHGKVSFQGGNLPSVGLLTRLDAMLNEKVSADGFMVVKQPPSYLVVKSQLISEFGEAAFDSCKKQVLKKLNDAASFAGAGAGAGGGGGGGGGGGAGGAGRAGLASSSTGAVVSARQQSLQPPWTMIAPEYAALITGGDGRGGGGGAGGGGPSARPAPPPAIIPMSVDQYTVDFTLCERVLREAQERKVAEAERVRLKAARKAAAEAQAVAEAASKREAEEAAAAVKDQAEREAAAVKASREVAARDADARVAAGAREQEAARAALQASRAGFDVDDDVVGAVGAAGAAITNPFADAAAGTVSAVSAVGAMPPPLHSNSGGGGGGDAPPPAYNAVATTHTAAAAAAVAASSSAVPPPPPPQSQYQHQRHQQAAASPYTSTATSSLPTAGSVQSGPPARPPPPTRQRGKVLTVLTTNVASGQVLQVKSGSILDSDCTAIVNAANSQLRHEGGIAAVIARAAGAALYQECAGVSVPEGNAHLTTSGFLARNGPKHVIHAVAPAWHQHARQAAGQIQIMHRTVMHCLDKAAAARVDSVDFPALGTGIFGWPDNVGTREIAIAVVRWLAANPHACVKRVCFTDIDAEKVRLFVEAVEDAAAPGGGGDGGGRAGGAGGVAAATTAAAAAAVLPQDVCTYSSARGKCSRDTEDSPSNRFCTRHLCESDGCGRCKPSADKYCDAHKHLQGPTGGAGGGWACGACTFVNKPSAAACDICTSPRA